ncbi:hypothetical protein [Halomonas caseinilytica]|uniref:Prophage tail length tape measure protein n=1 Tax=Halomonas caseinilytica TaxID=438744 RepID=A0A1M6UGB7_9GAMM|nr:hypothetical protein [Halomonas caseinilytica]SHK68272.1 hypothetical protein SAMN05192556_104258 [Halomonas caseinilytica]
MATRSLGQLTLDLVARISGFEKPLEQAARTSQRRMRQIERDGRDAARGVATVATAAAAAGAGVLAYSHHAAQSARETQRQAQIANTTAKEMQALGYASESVGVQQDKLADIYKDVNDRVGDFLNTGGGEMKDFFEKIAPQVGVTAEQFRNLSGPEALQLYYDSLEKANLSQSEMTFYLESVADETSALIPLLRDGGKEFRNLADEADTLGIVLSDAQIETLDDMGHDLDRVMGIMSGATQVAVAELAPGLSAVADEAIDLATAFREGDYSTQVEILSTAASVATGAASAYAAYRSAVAAATIAQWAFNAAVNANALVALITVSGAAVGAIYAYREELGLTDPVARAADEAMDRLSGSIEDTNKAALDSDYEALTLELQSIGLEAERAAAQLDDLEARQSFYSDSHLGVAASAEGAAEDQRALLGALKQREREIEAAIEKNRRRREQLGSGDSDDDNVDPGGGGGGSTTSDETDAIQRQIDALKLQAATLGMTEEEQQLYKLAADGATDAQLAQARAAQEAISSYEDQQQALDDYRQMVESLRTPEEQLNDQLQRRLDLLEQAEVSPEERQKLLPRIIDEGFSDAPEFEGLDATIGGPSSELDKIEEAEERLQEWYDTQLEQLATYREERAELEETWNAQERALKQAHEDELARIESARQYAQLAAAESVFGDLSELTEMFVGEQSGAYRALFATQKAFSVASVLLSSADAIGKAWASAPFPANLPAVAIATAETGALSAMVEGISLAGMAHDGIDRVPQEGTWLLDKGERVLTAEQADRSDKVDRAIASIAEGQRNAGQGALPGEGELPPIYVDARQSSDPVAMEQAARRGAEEGYRKVFEDVATNGAIRRALGA